MARTRIEDGVELALTPEEETARDAEELAWANAKPMEDWKNSIQKTDFYMPRFLEDLITDNPDFNIHENMKTRYDEKVALRATQPKE